jgi:DNA-binding NarL/FixJ family response regulator
MIRVVLTDDHPIVLEGIAMILEDARDIQVAGQAQTASETLAMVAGEKPNVLVLDLELPDRSGLDLIAEAKAVLPALRIVIFTAYGGRERIATALERGADAYVLKGTPSNELLEAIRTVARGQRYLPAAIASELVDALRSPARARLTEREREILRLLAEGLANKEISARLGIAERTVKFHVSEILARLGASNRAHAVTVAQKAGLL